MTRGGCRVGNPAAAPWSGEYISGVEPWRRRHVPDFCVACVEILPLFGKSDEELRALGVIASVAEGPGSPCRVSMRDAKAGERVLLLNHEHQDAQTPFRASHAIYVIDGAEEARFKPGELAEAIRTRLLSVRAFSREGMMIDADIVEGGAASEVFEQMLDKGDVAYLHAHYAKFGCYAGRVDRV